MFFYSLGIYFYTFSIRVASLFNPKAKLWVKGRTNWREELKNKLDKIGTYPKIWVHCASLGEFEQGRPIIEKLKQDHPKYKIILSFFSPSGYEVRKNYELADVVTYLPADTKKNMRDFINCCHPHTVIFIKYEFWLNCLFELNRKKIPAFLASAIIKEHQPFFKWYGAPFIKALGTFKRIIVQDKRSLDLLNSLNIHSGVIGGDTRIDRVLSLREKHLHLPEIKKFSDHHWTIVAGSTWPKDEELLIDVFIKLRKQYEAVRLIIAPHETDEKNIKRIVQLLRSKMQETSFSLYSSLNTFASSEILIINTIGILSSVYQYGSIAYIGGGFDDGIHNILEPATYGLPIAFGPNNKKFNEAKDLIEIGGAKEITNENELYKVLEKHFLVKELHQKASQAAMQYIDSNKGAYEKVISELSL